MRPNRLGTAEWSDPEQFGLANAFDSGQFWLGRSPTSDEQALGYNDDRHVCLVSGSRGGKGTTTIVPNLCLWPGSALVIDPKGENATLTAARRAGGSEECDGLGQRVYVLDPFEKAQVSTELRGRFNPFDDLDPSDPRTIDDAAKIADAIVVMNPESKDPFWDESARSLVKTLILHILTSPMFEGRRNLLTLRELVLHGDRTSVAMLREMGDSDIPTGQAFLWEGVSRNETFDGVISGAGTRFRDMSLNAAKQFESVLQVVDRNTEFLDSPGMRSVLESSDFSMSDLKSDPNGVSVYLSLPQSYMNTHFRWLRMMLALFIAEMEHVPGQPASGHRILVCMDEFAGLRRMEFIETAVSQIAGFGVKLFFVLQSLEQLKATYEKSWETFLSNAGLKLFYSIEDQFSREYVSKLVGDTEIIRTTSSTSQTDGRSSTMTEGRSENQSSSESIGTNSSTGRTTTRGRNQGGSRSEGWDSMLMLRDTSQFFAALTGERRSSDGSNWGKSRSKGSSSTTGRSNTHGRSSTHGTSSSTASGTSHSNTQGQSESVHKRPLIMPEEIGSYFARIDDPTSAMAPGIGLVLISGQSPAVIKRCNYFADDFFRRKFVPSPDHPLPSLEPARAPSTARRLSSGYRPQAAVWLPSDQFMRVTRSRVSIEQSGYDFFEPDEQTRFETAASPHPKSKTRGLFKKMTGTQQNRDHAKVFITDRRFLLMDYKLNGVFEVFSVPFWALDRVERASKLPGQPFDHFDAIAIDDGREVPMRFHVHDDVDLDRELRALVRLGLWEGALA